MLSLHQSLHNWLAHQRTRRKNMLNRRLASQSKPYQVMTQLEFDKLKELGVDPDRNEIELGQARNIQAAREKWNAQYEKLVQFKTQHGHVSPTHQDDAVCMHQ
jgi:hypothetical protein